MAKTDFTTAAVIGTGMMGPGIAVTLALGGVHATILSRTAEGAAKGLEKARNQARLLFENGFAPTADLPIDASSDFDAHIARVGLVVESATEDMKFKQDLFARMDAMARPEAVLATNTSGLSITEIQSACARPERVLTAHFWNPPHLMPLVELVLGERTSPAIAAELRDLLARCGKIPVVVKKDRPGQLGNRLQMALVREAAHIVGEGIASAEDVDAAARYGFGLRLPAYGILEHQDMVGLDLGNAVLEYVTQDLNNDPHAPALARRLQAEGKLGVKAGQGYYDWSVKSAEETRNRRDGFILEMMKRRAGIA